MAVVDVSYITPTSFLIVSTLLPGLAIITVATRFYIRRHQRMKLLWDDWLVLVGLILTIGMAIAQIIGVAGHGVGYSKGIPASDPPETELYWLSPQVVLFEQVQFAVQLMQPLALGCIKASFLMFYRRIFCTGNRTWFSVFTAAMISLIVVWSVAYSLAYVLYCGNKPWAVWSTVLDIETYCPDAFQIHESFAVSDFVMDVMIILAPIPAIWRLHMDWPRKVSILAIFMLGLIAIAASLIRMVVVIIVSNAGFDVSLDGDLVIGSILFWSMVEDNAALIAACLPTMSIIFKRSSLENMVRSVRSMLSLQSLGYSRSQNSSNAAPSTGLPRQSDNDADEKYHLTRLQGEPTVETHIDHSDRSESVAEQDGIAVQKDLLQEEAFH